jgi:hypothetical protein
MRDIIDMAREAGVRSADGYKLTVSHMSVDTLKRLEALIRADEREECAKLAATPVGTIAKFIRTRRKGGDYDRYERSEP